MTISIVLAGIDSLNFCRLRAYYVDHGALKLFELVMKKRDLERLVVKRKDGKYTNQMLWDKVLNPVYTQKQGGRNFSSKARIVSTFLATPLFRLRFSLAENHWV